MKHNLNVKPCCISISICYCTNDISSKHRYYRFNRCSTAGPRIKKISIFLLPLDNYIIFILLLIKVIASSSITSKLLKTYNNYISIYKHISKKISIYRYLFPLNLSLKKSNFLSIWCPYGSGKATTFSNNCR